jgi:hypothetical protein
VVTITLDLALQAGSQPEGESLLAGRAYLRTTVTSCEAVRIMHSDSLHSWKKACTKAGLGGRRSRPVP